MSHSDELEKLHRRINDLESSLGYLQRDIASQNEMILVDEARIKKLERTIVHLSSKLDGMVSDGSESRTLEDDVPPHY